MGEGGKTVSCTSSRCDVCPICGSTDRDPFCTGFDRLYPRAETFDYVKCRACQMVYMSPMPAPEAIARFYGSDYHPHRQAQAKKIEERLSRPFNRFLVEHYLGARSPRSGPVRALARLLSHFGMEDTLAPHGQCRLLDVGCGSARWLYRHHLLGWRAEGVDLVPEACQKAHALGLTIYEGDIFAVARDSRYDVIAFRSVLEHVPNPLETMGRARDLVASDGSVLVLVPNIDSWSFSRYGIFWYPLDPPRHLLHFSPQTLLLLGERAGLRPIEIRTLPSTRWIVYSRRYARVFPLDSLQRRDPEERKALIEKASSFARNGRYGGPLLSALTRWQSTIQARRGRGEKILAIFRRAG